MCPNLKKKLIKTQKHKILKLEIANSSSLKQEITRHHGQRQSRKKVFFSSLPTDSESSLGPAWERPPEQAVNEYRRDGSPCHLSISRHNWSLVLTTMGSFQKRAAPEMKGHLSQEEGSFGADQGRGKETKRDSLISDCEQELFCLEACVWGNREEQGKVNNIG